MAGLKIAALCALPKPNPGMMSVDAALGDFLGRAQVQADIHVFSPLAQSVEIKGTKRFPARLYQPLPTTSRLEEFDLVIIWGDFLQARRYQTEVRDKLARADPSRSIASAQDLILGSMLLERASDKLLKKTICFGGSISINSISDDWDERYRSAIERLFGGAKLVLTRDPISAAFAQQYGASGTALGVDAAFLLNAANSQGTAPGGAIGYSFGRVVRGDLRAMLRVRRLIAGLRQRSGLKKTININWLRPDGEHPMQMLQTKLDVIKRCSFVITDTYHCALNSWREGVPAICVGYGARDEMNPLNEKKKELLYSMFNARGFYGYIETLGLMGIGRRADELAGALSNREDVSAVRKNIQIAVDRAQNRLLAALPA